MAKRAVLLLAHGTPNTVDEIPDYLRNVVSGRPMPQHVIEEIQHRYSLIGEPKGHSPLTELTEEQGRLVADELGGDVPVYVGMRNWRPYIADVVKQMRADGIEQAAVICMAPQNSRTSTGLYRRAAMAEAGEMKIDFTEEWSQHPLLAQAFAERLETAWSKLSGEVEAPVPVLFTAHSVPCRTIQEPRAQQEPQVHTTPATGGDATGKAQARFWPGGDAADPYAREAKHTAAHVAALLPKIQSWYFAFQSQGASGGPWIGPTVESTLDALAAEGVKALILQPIGFLCDHVEILYDIDIAFREYAGKLGMRLERPASLNGSATLAKAIADLARRSLDRLSHS